MKVVIHKKKKEMPFVFNARDTTISVLHFSLSNDVFARPIANKELKGLDDIATLYDAAQINAMEAQASRELWCNWARLLMQTKSAFPTGVCMYKAYAFCFDSVDKLKLAKEHKVDVANLLSTVSAQWETVEQFCEFLRASGGVTLDYYPTLSEARKHLGKYDFKRMRDVAPDPDVAPAPAISGPALPSPPSSLSMRAFALALALLSSALGSDGDTTETPLLFAEPCACACACSELPLPSIRSKADCVQRNDWE